MTNNPLDELQKMYVHNLEMAAWGYLTFGLKSFFSEQKQSSHGINQAIIGNLSIAVELLLKAFIARKNLLLLFKNLPIELRILITNPESMPDEFNWRSFEMEMKSASYLMIELDECIATFYLFFPNARHELQTHLKFLAKARNASVHSVLPIFQQEYEINRVVFTAIKVTEIIRKNMLFVGDVSNIYPDSTLFMQEFRESLITKVHKLVESAKEKAKKLPSKGKVSRQVNISYWNQAVFRCPVCDNLSIMNGQTAPTTWINNDQKEPGLWFVPNDFSCTECGLKLEGDDEMRFAGINLNSMEFDRSENLQDYHNDQFYSVTYFDQ